MLSKVELPALRLWPEDCDPMLELPLLLLLVVLLELPTLMLLKVLLPLPMVVVVSELGSEKTEDVTLNDGADPGALVVVVA